MAKVAELLVVLKLMVSAIESNDLDLLGEANKKRLSATKSLNSILQGRGIEMED